MACRVRSRAHTYVRTQQNRIFETPREKAGHPSSVDKITKKSRTYVPVYEFKDMIGQKAAERILSYYFSFFKK